MVCEVNPEVEEKIKKIIADGVMSVYSINNLPLTLSDIQVIENEYRTQILVIGISKTNKMALIFNAILPKNFIPDNLWSLPIAFNEFLKLILSKLTEYSLRELTNTPLRWGMILTIEFDSAVSPIKKYKEVKILINSNYKIEIKETFENINRIQISFVKTVPELLLSKKILEDTIITLNMLSELSLIDINHRLRTGIYSLRVFPIKLLIMTNNPNIRFNSINITVDKKTMKIRIVSNEVNEFEVPLRLIEGGGWIPKVLNSMVPILVKQ